MRSIYLTNEELAPIIAKLANGEKNLAEGQELLNKLNKEKEEYEARVAKLRSDSENCRKKKDATIAELDQNNFRLMRAKKLLGGLEEEKSRWQLEVKR